MQVSVVLPEHIEELWPQINGYAERCAKYTYGRFTAEDMKIGVLTNPAQQLWIGYDERGIVGFWITEIIDYPQMRTLMLHFVGGKDFHSWRVVGFPILLRFCKDHGCEVMESYGRPGWKKFWEAEGYKARFVFYELPVDN
jgi:hypothetical protein